MRLFVAMDIPEETRRALAALIKDFAAICPAARWVRAQGIHVTLKFIGHVNDEMVLRIKETLSGVRRDHAITVAFRDFGFFPNERHARVFFVGIQANKELGVLAREVEERLALLGIPKDDRAFRPHLTLARFKTSEGLPALREKIASLPSQDFGASEIGEFHLYQSVLGSNGAMYTKLSTHSFVSKG